MRHFDHLDGADRARLFCREPEPVDPGAAHDLRAVALGATLYSPGSRPRLDADLARARARGVASSVVCLEDSVPDAALAAAEANLVERLRDVHAAGWSVPRLFVRVRSPEQLLDVATRLGAAAAQLEGFVLPKFTPAVGAGYLQAVTAAEAVAGHPLVVMPVVESPEVIHLETRARVLAELAALLDEHRDRVLAVRLGATDFSGTYGLRRPTGMTIYDVRVVATVIADVVNVLGREDGTGFVVTGPVWEYFGGGERIFRPGLRSSVFDEHGAPELREQLIDRALDGLIREVELDKANGLTGKSVIHPSHVAAVHALQVVSHEEHSDATDVLAPAGGSGVLASGYGNKMNEVNPHRGWARRTLLRARAFGVAAPDVSFVDLLAAAP